MGVQPATGSATLVVESTWNGEPAGPPVMRRMSLLAETDTLAMVGGVMATTRRVPSVTVVFCHARPAASAGRFVVAKAPL